MPKQNRRKFIKTTSIAALAVSKNAIAHKVPGKSKAKAMVISTWRHGIEANEAAYQLLKKGEKAVDAVEQGVKVVESDPDVSTVGLGGTPDRDGKVTLDACIMDEKGNAGSVCFLQHIENPISVARKVMDESPHVMLSGQGALEFALSKGFKKTDLLTPSSKKRWEEWKKTSSYKPVINIENHDTIGLLALDKKGNLAGACTTSGMAFKMHGRIGDSPVIGAGLYVDNDVGGATATGMGELMLKTLGSFLVVELMRNGASPQEACKEAVMRIVRKLDYQDLQAGYLAISKNGDYGAFSLHKGFNYALMKKGENKLLDSEYYVG